MEWNKHQTAAIEKRAPRLLISASAGSGKTTVLIERIIRLIKEGESVENMLVSTFTKAAAAEMKARIYRVLNEMPDSPALTKQLELLPAADITNFHSWCQRQILRYFYHLNIDPGFSVMDENEAGAMIDECLEEVIESEIKESRSDFLLFYEILRSGRNDNVFKSYIKDVYRFSRMQPEPKEWLGLYSIRNDEAVLEKIEKVFLSERQKLLKRITVLRELCERAGFVRNLTYIEELEDYLCGRTLQLSVPRGRITAEFAKLNDAFICIKNDVKSYFKRKDTVKSASSSDCSAGKAALLERMTAALDILYSAEKNRKARLDFSDLEQYMRRLMKNPDVLGDLCKKYKYVFIDEYQDINPLQSEILELLAETSEMFYVGDVKQSIYAFRGCSPEIFISKLESLGAVSPEAVITLNDNYRSGKEILEFCNEVFSSVMTKDLGGIDYKASGAFSLDGHNAGANVRLCFVRDKPTGGSTALSGVYSVTDIAKGDDSDFTEAETNLIAERILQLRLKNVNENGIARPVKMSEIIVLLRSGGDYADMLFKKLRRLGINASMSEKIRFESERVTRALIDFLTVIDNDFNDIALISAMLSFFGGFDENDLAAIRLASPDTENYFEAVYNYRADDAIGRKLAAFMLRLQYYKELSRTLKADELAGRIVSDTDYFKYVFGLDDGLKKADMLNGFLAHITACPANETVYTYLKYLEREQPVSEPAEAADSVRIMTIHASKGLEFPFVILAGMSRQFNFADLKERMILDQMLGICLKHWNEETHEVCLTPSWQLAAMRLKKQMAEEELRLLYVAMTRAKNELHIFGSIKEGGSEDLFLSLAGLEAGLADYSHARSFTAWLAPMMKHAEFFTIADCAVELGENAVIVGEEANTDPVLIDKINERMDFCYPYKHAIQKTFVTRIAEEDSGSFSRAVAQIAESDDRAAETGTAYHKAMELINFESFDDSWDDLEFAGKELIDCSKIKKACAAVREKAQGCEVFREQSFLLNMPARELSEDGDGDIIVQGIIDLLLIKGGRAVIVDYKLGRRENLFKNNYRTQLSVYKRAAEDILGLKVDEALIYSFGSDSFVKIL